MLSMNTLQALFGLMTAASYRLFRSPRLTAALLTALLVGVGISAVYRGAWSDRQRTDFSVFVRAAQAVESGENIYDVKTSRQWNYVYLPLLALLSAGFTKIPFGAAVLIWYLLSAAALIAVLSLAARLGSNAREGFFAALTALVFSFPPILGTLARGQLGVLSLLIALAVFWLYLRKRDAAAGFLLGFGIVLKTSPLAPLIFFFLFRRSWKALFSCAAGGVFFALILPGLLAGHERNMFWLAEYLRLTSHAVSDRGYEGILWQQLVTPFAEDNQSLYAVLTRIAWGSEAAYIGHSNEIIRWAVRLAAALILAGGAAAALRNPKRSPAKRLLLEFSLYPMLMLWVSPVTQNHHYTAMFLLFLAGALYLTPDDSSEQRIPERNRFLAGLCLAGLSFLAGLIVEDLAWWGLPVWGTLLGASLMYVPALWLTRTKENSETDQR